VPEVSVLLAVHNEARYVATAVESVLRQTMVDLELIVVDDASTDATSSILRRFSDPRVVLVTNDDQVGLAVSLNRALERVSGRYVARLDADDVAFADRLSRQLARIRAAPAVSIVGGAVLDIDADGRPGGLHRLPTGPDAVRWHALFGSPFFHPTVLVEREALGDRRYDSAYLESEDYELWTRLLASVDGDNVPDPVVLKRVHAGQASSRRGDLQRSFAREIALREITRLAPDLVDAELAWELGSGLPVSDRGKATRAFLELLEAFEQRHGVDRCVRDAAARRLARAGRLRAALRLSPALPIRVAIGRARARSERGRAIGRLSRVASQPRVIIVSPEPTPYRAPLFDRIAERDELDLTVIYAARTVADRTWSVTHHHRALFLRGRSVPGLRPVLRHDYPVTPGITRALARSSPSVVVVSGWSTFASQAAIAWCRMCRVPYVLLVESHDAEPRAVWRRVVKGAVVPALVRRADAWLAVGSLARESLIARGADPGRVRTFANTIDVERWIERADALRVRRQELRAALGVADDSVVVLSVARLAPEKGLETLADAVGRIGSERVFLAVAGSGPLRDRLQDRLCLLGELDEEHLAEAYVAADVFALLSTHEPWGVVVNEAAASGLPLVLADSVGAARDLLRDGQNGLLVAAGDVDASTAALETLATEVELRRRFGERSRELVREWSYEPSVENFVAAVREAATAR
jgi:glycosyltransferase involved in cell wall biosynthesis